MYLAIAVKLDATGNGLRCGSAVIATATLTSGVASVTTTTLNAGTDTLSCYYSGDSTYAPSTCNSIPITITAAPTTLSLTSNLWWVESLRIYDPDSYNARLESK